MQNHGAKMFFYVISVPLLVGLSALLSVRCGSDNAVEMSGVYLRKGGTDDDNFGGAAESTFHLPTNPDQSLQCVQGANGAHSHRSRSTRFDIDLDTSNIRDEPVYSPVQGTVSVFLTNTRTNFGKHLNIDLGNGTYVIIAHMDMIVVRDGTEVAEGQLLGYEGCTGNCTGDHIHLGLHRGDARRPGQFGESIVSNLIVADAGAPRGYKSLRTNEFNCSLEHGTFYASALNIVLFHPNGTLVKTAHDPKVYRIDEGNVRWITEESVFRTYNYSFGDVAIISEEELSCYGEGPRLNQAGLVDAVSDTNGQLWLVVGPRARADRYRIAVERDAWEGVLSSWGLSYDFREPETVRSGHTYLRDWTVRPGRAKFRDGAIVRERDRSDLYVISDGVAMPVRDWQTYLLLGFHSRNIITVEQGMVSRVQGLVGTCALGLLCLDSNIVMACGGAESLETEQDPQADDVSDSDDDLQAAVARDDDSREESDVPDDEVRNDAPEDVQDDDSAQEANQEESAAEADSQEPAQPAEQGAPEQDAPEEEAQEEEVEALQPVLVCNDDACLVDANGDGVDETLVMADDLWMHESLIAQDAFVYANGGCFDGRLTEPDRVSSGLIDGFYSIDFSGFDRACASQLTLISSIGTNGRSPDRRMGNWFWWQNFFFCREGTTLCNLMNNGADWEEWLVSVAWDPATGLRANGNGFTSNSQLNR